MTWPNVVTSAAQEPELSENGWHLAFNTAKEYRIKHLVHSLPTNAVTVYLPSNILHRPTHPRYGLLDSTSRRTATGSRTTVKLKDRSDVADATVDI